MPTLDWLDREQAMRRADVVPYRLLEHVSSHGDPSALRRCARCLYAERARTSKNNPISSRVRLAIAVPKMLVVIGNRRARSCYRRLSAFIGGFIIIFLGGLGVPSTRSGQAWRFNSVFRSSSLVTHH
jgi:hypothetical protein